MPTLDQVSAGASAITQINANEQSMQVAAAYGRRASTSSGLVFGYYGATLQDGSTVANGTITVGASTTTYVVANRSTGAVTSATNTTNFNNTSTYMRVAILVSNASGITSYTDARPVGGLASGGGGGGTPGGSTTQVQVNNAGSFAGYSDFTYTAGQVTVPALTATGLVLTPASASGGAGFRIPHGAAPSSPVNGDMWTTSAGGLYVRINGVTVGPLGSGGGGGGGVTIDASLLDLITGTSTLSAVDAGSDKLQGWDDSANKATYFAPTYGLKTNGTDLRGALQTIAVAVTDSSTAITTGTNKMGIFMPYDFTVVEVQASLRTAQASGSIFTVDVNENGTSIISTKLTIDNTERTSQTAATPPVISDASLAKGSEITFDVDQIGTSGAAGLVVYLVGYPT